MYEMISDDILGVVIYVTEYSSSIHSTDGLVSLRMGELPAWRILDCHTELQCVSLKEFLSMQTTESANNSSNTSSNTSSINNNKGRFSRPLPTKR